MSHAEGYGLYMRYGELTEFLNNDFSDNESTSIAMNADQVGKLDENTTFSANGFNGVEIFSGNGRKLTQESTWVNLDGTASYHLPTGLDISAGLTLSPGIKMYIDENKEITVASGAYLKAEGTSTDRIIFTTIDEASTLRWGGIRILSSSTLNIFDYVTVSYGGGQQQDLSEFKDINTNIGGNNDSNLTLTNSIIENSGNYGVYFQGTINDIESVGANNQFNNNPGGNSYTP